MTADELVVVKGLKEVGVMNVNKNLFAVLPDELESILRDGNPWWRGEPIFKLPQDAPMGVHACVARTARWFDSGRCTASPGRKSVRRRA